MLVAVAIIVILLAVGTPAMQSFLQNVQIRSNAENMMSGLTLARAEAVRRNTPVTFWIVSDITAACALSATGNAWVVSIASPASNCNAIASETNAPQLVQARSLADSSRNVLVDGGAGNCVTFNGFGRVDATCAGSVASPVVGIDVSSQVAPATTRALRITVAGGGAIRVCDPAAKSSDIAAC